MHKQQAGYTLVELIVYLAVVALYGAAGYVIVHFIIKFW